MDQVCNKEGCRSAYLLKEDPKLCVRIFLPTNKDGALAASWASGMDLELASRLNGEACDKAKFFPVYTSDADYVSGAIKLIDFALHNKPELLKHVDIRAETLECLLKSQNAHISGGGTVDESGDFISVSVVLEGCDYQKRSVEATFRTRKSEAAPKFTQPNTVALTYKVPFVD